MVWIFPSFLYYISFRHFQQEQKYTYHITFITFKRFRYQILSHKNINIMITYLSLLPPKITWMKFDTYTPDRKKNARGSPKTNRIKYINSILSSDEIIIIGNKNPKCTASLRTKYFSIETFIHHQTSPKHVIQAHKWLGKKWLL